MKLVSVIKIKIALMLFFIPLIAMGYDGWSGPNKIKTIRVYSGDAVLITMSGANNPGNCSDTSYLSLFNPATESGKKRYSALLSAYMADKTVNLALTGCSGGGTTGWPQIEQVWLQ